MSYSVKIIVYAQDDSRVLQLVREAIEADGARVQVFTSRIAADGERELYVELRLGDARMLGGIIRRVEGVRGAAIMAATEPEAISLPKSQ